MRPVATFHLLPAPPVPPAPRLLLLLAATSAATGSVHLHFHGIDSTKMRADTPAAATGRINPLASLRQLPLKKPHRPGKCAARKKSINTPRMLHDCFTAAGARGDFLAGGLVALSPLGCKEWKRFHGTSKYCGLSKYLSIKYSATHRFYNGVVLKVHIAAVETLAFGAPESGPRRVASEDFFPKIGKVSSAASATRSARARMTDVNTAQLLHSG